MKPMRYISLIIALLSVLGLAAQQQQSQYALYNYRNDGDFNAWLNIDIDSITYSNIGLDSVEYDNIVTQEVWTPDSCYRIPIEVIDSIGFRAPEPEFKEGIFHITEDHIPYTVVVDSLSVTFDSSIPASMLPAVGQVVISDVYGEPYDAGFAGRVVNIVYEDGMTRIECEEVGLEDVYDQLICVGKTIAYEDDDNIHSSRRKSPRIIRINEDGVVELPLGKFDLDLLTYKEIDEFTQQPTGDKTNYVKVTAKPSLIVDYAIRYNVKGQDDVIKFVLGKKCELEFDMKWPKSVKLVDWEKYLDTFIPIPTSAPAVYSKICFGAYLEMDGDVTLEAKFPFTFQENVGYDSQNDYMGGIVYNFQGSELEIPELSASINASISVGLAAKYVTCVVAEKLASANLKVKTGTKLSGKIEVSTNGYTDGGWSWYESMKDSKVTWEPLVVTVSGGTEIFGKNRDWKYTLPIPDYVDFLKKKELYLFPEFTKPALGSIKNSKYQGTAMTTTTTRNLLLPVFVGLRLYDESTETDYEFWSEEAYRWENKWDNSKVQADMAKFAAGSTFNVRPVFMNAFYGTIKAKPETEFTVPEPMTLDINTPLNSVTLSKGQNAFYAINGGWGDYSAHSSMRAICDAEIVMNNDKPYVKISASNRMTGPATVTVKDLRAGTTETILVTVSSDAVPELTVSEQAVTLQESESKTILVTSGSGSYTAESSDESVATAIVEENNIAITAVGKGSASILVTDTETEKTVDIVVTVTGEAVLVTSITLSQTTLSLQEGKTQTLTATVLPEDAENKTLAWESSNEAVATVSTDGLVTAVAEGSCVITCSAVDGSGVFAECEVTVSSGTTPDPGNHAWVDLGLPSGTKWATCNVGANSPEEYGDYFAWGETEPKDYYDYSTYTWCNGSYDTMTKYCIHSEYGYNGFTDGLTELLPEDDAATANWGSPWHMPTYEQIEELVDNCTREWTTQGGVYGILVTGPNGNSIFLPAAGYRWNGDLYRAGSLGYYWSSSLGTSFSRSAYYLRFDSGYWDWDYSYRGYGHSVRAVRP